MVQQPGKSKTRSIAELREHYEIEKELANRLRKASKEERQTLYASLYDELFLRVPNHPQLTRKASPEEQKHAVDKQLRYLNRFLDGNSTYLEIGAGDCALAIEIARSVNKVYAVDVSDEITKGCERPDNFELVLSDGSSIPVPANSINVAYSNQLMEHLHPDDVDEQLRNIYNALAPGGKYFCITPNRLSGPHDISKYFDNEVHGFHLKEYTYTELSTLFKKVGFSKVKAFIGLKDAFISIPNTIIFLYEAILEVLPYSLRMSLLKIKPFRMPLSLWVVGIK
jgi:ubiquinone/menaquinone biosynthesis C-methylase UbiE